MMDQVISWEQYLWQAGLDLSHRMSELQKLREAVHLAEARQNASAPSRRQGPPPNSISYGETYLPA
jgi:hypothetical protein